MSARASTTDAVAARVSDGLKLVLGQFASAMKAVEASPPFQATLAGMKAVEASPPFKAGQQYTLAGDELNPKDVDRFLQVMGVPETAPENNTLLQLAKVTARTTPGEPEASAEALAGIPGPTSDAVAVCHRLKTLLDNGLASMSNKKKKKLRGMSAAAVKAIIPLLKGDEFGTKLVHTLAGLGFFGVAGWLVWSAKEQAWKVGTWGVLVIGAIRLLGNLIYNDHDAVKQTWNMVYVHVGLGAVAYALEIAERCGFEFERNPKTIATTFFLNVIPVLVFYFGDLWAAGEDWRYRRAHKRSGRASAEDVELIRPIYDTIQNYLSTSKDALGESSANKPGNRTKEVALKAQAGLQRLFNRLKLDVSPEDERTWKELFSLLLREAATKAASILYSLFTGIFLFVAAIGDGKALSDVAVLILILFVEMGKGITDEDIAADTLGYRAIKLTLGRFFSIFTYAVPKIWYRIKTHGETDLFNKNPEMATILAHVGATLICVLGLWVIPTFELFVACSKRATRRSARARQSVAEAGAALELEGGTAVPAAYEVPKHLLGDLDDEDEEMVDDVDADDDDEEDVPDLLTWDEDDDSDGEVDEAEVEMWGEVMDKLTLDAVRGMAEEMDGWSKKREDTGPGFYSEAAAMGAFGHSSEATPEFFEVLDRMFD
ncbi:hypothetical protein GGE45_003961 [Rhizobium aethiopicum]|uniref:hypothetical protein n=1 Tax=Rhizobium aethiopicum TaxID=1138170 RepID=UPI0016176F07|nr:hypothetical protein [Rhizobium aethiopicum]MBB4581613.1 hypothetical protein [Rhizobium aethiopicum]